MRFGKGDRRVVKMTGGYVRPSLTKQRCATLGYGGMVIEWGGSAGGTTAHSFWSYGGQEAHRPSDLRALRPKIAQFHQLRPGKTYLSFQKKKLW